MEERKWYDPTLVFEQYKKGVEFKNALSDRGMYEQNRMNERFFIGDQWHGAQCGDERPLVRHNLIKRIGDYKMSMIGGTSLAVTYTAEGVPNTKDIKKNVRMLREQLREQSGGAPMTDMPRGAGNSAEEVNLVMSAMSDYYRVTAERVKFDDLKTAALRKAYITGTGILYTYWDPRLQTGLYADESHTEPIRGDIRCETLDVENVYFGDPNLDSVQEQPYILIARRRRVEDVRREARADGMKKDKVDSIVPDNDMGNEAGDISQKEPNDAERVLVITKLYKQWNDEGTAYSIHAVTVTKGCTVRKHWDTGVTMYPIAKLSWESRPNCVYGESEVTHLIPNQIAVNRALTAEIWAAVEDGMPTLLVNGDAVPGDFTNDPGQTIRVYGEDLGNVMRYVTAGGFQGQFDSMVNNLIGNTLTQAGANDAALGDIRPDNTSAIIAVREAATMPMQLLQNRFYSFVEDVARIWAEFWTKKYGRRSLKVEDEAGEWYLPFDGEKYHDLMITARVDVGAASMWSEVQSVKTLDNLYERQVIDVEQYLERLPRGSVPQLSQLLREIQERKEAAQAAAQQQAAAAAQGGAQPTAGVNIASVVQALPDEYKQAYQQMPPEMRQRVVERLVQGGTVQ